MTNGWQIIRHIPYEGEYTEEYDSAAEVIDALNKLPPAYREDTRIEPIPSSNYEPWEFEAAYKIGEVT